MNGIFIVRCKKEQAQWEGATPLDMMNHFSKDARRSKLKGENKTKSNPGRVVRCKKERAQ